MRLNQTFINASNFRFNKCGISGCGVKMDNYDKIIFVMENRGWKNGKLIEFIKRSKYKMDESLVDKNCLNKLSIPLDEPVIVKLAGETNVVTEDEKTIIKALLVSKMMDFTYAISEHIFMDDKEKKRLQKQLDSMQTILSKFSA